jgi:hypothetical protein
MAGKQVAAMATLIEFADTLVSGYDLLDYRALAHGYRSVYARNHNRRLRDIAAAVVAGSIGARDLLPTEGQR